MQALLGMGGVVIEDRYVDTMSPRMQIIFALKKYREPLTVKDLARRIGLHRSTVWRNIRWLLENGFVRSRLVSDRVGDAYYLT